MISIKKRIAAIEAGEVDDVAVAAFRMCDEGYESKAWAKKMIEKGQGDVAWAACFMRERGLASTEWAKEMIEKIIGDVEWAARERERGDASNEWGMAMIEKMIGDVEWAAFAMYREGYASKAWADKMKRLHGKGKPHEKH